MNLHEQLGIAHTAYTNILRDEEEREGEEWER
jgi:hypothetical protein